MPLMLYMQHCNTNKCFLNVCLKVSSLSNASQRQSGGKFVCDGTLYCHLLRDVCCVRLLETSQEIKAFGYSSSENEDALLSGNLSRILVLVIWLQFSICMSLYYNPQTVFIRYSVTSALLLLVNHTPVTTCVHPDLVLFFLLIIFSGIFGCPVLLCFAMPIVVVLWQSCHYFCSMCDDNNHIIVV